MNTLRDEIKEIMLSNIEGIDMHEDRYYLENDAIPSCGSVGGLIYYSETETLAKKYHDEIIELMKEYGIDKHLTLNDMAWFAYEALSYELIDEVLTMVEYPESA